MEGRNQYLGLFRTIEDAAAARSEALAQQRVETSRYVYSHPGDERLEAR